MFQLVAIASLVVSAYATGGWDPSICCYPPPDECCPPVVTDAPCPDCLDIAFVVDISSSIGNVRLQNIINPYLQMFANSPLWDIGYGANQVQASMTTFANEGTLIWGWGSPQTATQADLAYNMGLLTTTQFQGLTNTGDALLVTREQVLEGPGNRPECPDVCVVITDGHVTREPEKFPVQAPLFKAACDLSIVIGITTAVNPEELQAMATNFDNIFMIEDFDALASTFTAVMDQITCPPMPTTAPVVDPNACCPYEYPFYYQLGGVF